MSFNDPELNMVWFTSEIGVRSLGGHSQTHDEFCDIKCQQQNVFLGCHPNYHWYRTTALCPSDCEQNYSRQHATCLNVNKDQIHHLKLTETSILAKL